MERALPANIYKTVLPNGLRVVTESMPAVRSVSLGVWLNAGSRHETDPESGITHFIEHMVFKGTNRFSARELACEIDGLGGNLDAFTSKETTAFTAKVLDEHWPRALDILADMVQNPTLAEDEIEREKGVILEELKMDEDNPDYLLGTIFAGSFWRGHGMGRPVIGTQESIRGFRRSRLRQFFADTFRASNLMLAAAGNIDHDEFARAAERHFGGLAGTGMAEPEQPPQGQAEIVLRDKPSLEQVHVLLGVETFSALDPRRFAGLVLSTLLGGGFSSRLFQKIREEAGLAYSVYSDLGLYSDAGCLSVGAGTSLEALRTVLQYALREFRDLKDRRAPEPEIRRAKDHLKGSLMLSLESTSSRMANLARQEAIHGHVRTLDEISDQIESVTAPEVEALANEWFQQDRIALTVLGNLDGLRIERADLAC
ncbi:MAG: pitrilysin family protein [Bryobacterales bacterium]|nr:pitrilysin family protein [Bryobacterales bacterium]MDE0623386.1 pitrilysin family protein [Bryobacterales bacterium]